MAKACGSESKVLRARCGRRTRACGWPFVLCDHRVYRRRDDGRRRRLEVQDRLLNKKSRLGEGRLGRVLVLGAGVIGIGGQVRVTVPVGRHGPGAAETVAAPAEAEDPAPPRRWAQASLAANHTQGAQTSRVGSSAAWLALVRRA